MQIQRGDIFYASLHGSEGSVQGGMRPVIILQNDQGNLHSPTTVVAPLTSHRKKRSLPVHVLLRADRINGLRCDSMALLEQVQTIDKSSLGTKLGRVCDMSAVDKALMVSFGLADSF